MLWMLIAASLACAGLGGYVAAVKDRPVFEGVIFGGLLGPLGVLVEALLPVPRCEPDSDSLMFRLNQGKKGVQERRESAPTLQKSVSPR